MSDTSDRSLALSPSGRVNARTTRGMASRRERAARAKPRVKAKAASPAEMASRVDRIVGMMQADEWRPDSAVQLAESWQVSLSTVENLSAEASRRVVYLARLSANPEELRTDVTNVLMRSLHAAHSERARGDVARLGDIVTKIVGARAPEQHKLDLTVRQFEELTPAAMRAKLLEQRAKIDEALAKLEEKPLALAEGPDESPKEDAPSAAYWLGQPPQFIGQSEAKDKP